MEPGVSHAADATALFTPHLDEDSKQSDSGGELEHKNCSNASLEGIDDADAEAIVVSSADLHGTEHN